MSRLSFIRRVTLLYAVLIALVVIGSGLDLCHSLRSIVDTYSNDKVLHFVLVGMLALLLNLSMQLQTVGSNIFFQRGTAIMLLIATAEEFSQAFIPARDFEWFDLGSNYLGIVVLGSTALMLAFVIRPPVLKQRSGRTAQAL